MAEELGSMIYSVKMELDDTQIKGGVDDLKAQFSDMGKQASSEFNKAFFNDRQLVDAGYNSYQNPLFFMREYYKTQSQQIKDAVRRASNTAEEHYSGLETSSPLARRIANTQYQSALRNAHNAFSDTAIVRDLAHSFIQDFSDQLKDSNLSQILSASVDGITKQILTKVNHSVGINYKARQLADYVAGEQGGEFQKLVGNLSRAGYADSTKMATRFTELIAKARVAPYRQYENMVNKPVTASNFYTSFSSMLPNNVKKVFQEYDKITKFDHGDSPAISDKVMQKLTARAQTDAYLLNTMKRLGMARITNGRAALATNLTNRDLSAIVGSLLEETVDAAKGMQMYGITKASQLDDPDYVEKVIRKQNQRIRGFRDTLSYMDNISSGSAGYVPARYRAADVRAIRRTYGTNTFAAPYVDLRRRFEVPYYNMSDIVIGKDGKARTQHDWMKETDSSLDNWERFHHEAIDESLAVNAILAKSGQRELRNNALMRGIIKIKHPDNYLDMSKAEQKQIDDMFANMVDNGLYIKGKKNPMVLASLSNGEMTFVDKPIKDRIENDPKYGKGFFYSGVNPNTKTSYKDLISILNHGAKAFSGAYNTEEGLGVDTSQFNASNVLVVAGKTFGKNNVTTGLDGSSWISKDILGKAGQARALGMKYVLSTLDFGAMRDAYGYDLPVLLAGATDSRQYGKVTANTKAVINMSDIKDFEERFLNVDKNGNWTWKDRKDVNGNVIGKWDYNSMVNEVIQKDLRQIYMMRTAEEAEKSLSFIPGQSAGMLSMTAQEVRQNIDRYKEIMRKLDTPEGVKQYVLAGTSDENLAADLSEGLLGTEKYQRKVAEFKQSLRTHLLKNDIIVPEGITALSRMAMPYPVDFFNKMIDIYNNDQSVGNKLQLNDEIRSLTLGENGVYAPGIQGNISMNRSPSALGSWVTAQNLLNSEKVREELKKDPKKLAQIMGMDENGVFLSPGSVLLEYLQSADFDGDMLSIYSTATNDMLDKITDKNQRTSIVSFKNMIDRTIAQHNKLFERAYNYEKGNLTQEQIDSIENRPDEMSDALWSVIRPARIRKALNKHYEDVYAKQIDDLPDELKGDINLSSPGRAVAQYLGLVKKQSLSLGVPNAIGINGFNIGALSDKEAVALVQALTHYDIDSTMAKKTQYFQNTGEESSLLLNRTFGQLGGKIKNMRNERGDLDASKIHKNLSIDDLLRMSVPNSQASGAYLTSWLARSALAARFGDDGLSGMADTLIANAADESGVTKESAPALSKLRQSLLRIFRGQFSGEFVKVADQAMVDLNNQFEEATKEYNTNRTKGKTTPYGKAYLTAKDTYTRLMNQQNAFQTESANQTGDRFNAAVGKNIYTSREDLLSDADAKAIADAVTSEPDKLTLNSKRYSVLRDLETTAADEIYKKWFGNTSTRKVSFSMLTGLANGYQTPIDWANYLLTGATSDTEATRAGKAVEAAIEQYFKTGKTSEAIKTLEGQYDDASNRLNKNNGYYDVNKSFIQSNLGKIYSDLGLQYERSQLHVRLPGLGVDAKTTVGLPDELFTKDGKLYIGDIKNYKGGTDADTEKFHQMQLALYGGAQYKWSEIKDVAQRLNPALKKSKWNDESFHTLSEMGIELGGMFTMNPTTGIGSIHQYKADAETIASEYDKAGSMLSAIKQMISSKGSGHLTEKDIADLGVDLRKIMGIVTEAQAEALKTGNEYTATAQTEFGIGQDTITSALRADRAMVEADNRVAAIRKSLRPVDKNQRYYYSYGQKIRDLESDIELYESMRSTIGDVAATNRIQNAQQTINDIKIAAPGIASMAYTDFINSVNNNQAGVKEIKSLSAISSQFNTIATSIQEADDAYNVFVDGLTGGVVYDADKYEKLKQELETKENDRKATKKKKEKRELTNEINSITEQMNAMDKAKAAMDLGGLEEVTRLKDLAHKKLGEQFNRTASDYDVAVAKMLNNILDISGTQHGLSRNDYIQSYKSSLASVAAELDSSLKNFKGTSEQQQVLKEYVDSHLKKINNATTEDAVNAAADAYEEYERTHNAYNNRLDELEDQRYATQRRRQFIRNATMPQRYATTLGQSFGKMYALREFYSQAIEDNTLGKLEAETKLSDFMHEHGATTREELAAQPNAEKNVATYDALTKQIRNYSNALSDAEAAQAQFSGGTGVINATVQGIASSFDNLISRFGYRAFMTVINNIKNFVKQYEASLTEIQMITLKSDSEMAEVSANNMEMARGLNTNALQVSQIQSGLYRQGLSDEEVEKRTAAVIKLSRVSGINTNTASKIITTALQNGLVEDAEEAIDVLAALGDSAATTADEVQKALQKTAASAANAGVSYQELTAILTAAISKTQLSGNVVGTAFSTIMTRMRKISETGYVKASNGEITKANDVTSALSRVGVRVFEGDQMRDVVDILMDLAKVWNSIDSDLLKQNIVYSMAGRGANATNTFYTIMDAMGEDGEFARLLGIAQGANGIVDAKYDAFVDSFVGSLEALKGAFQEWTESVVNSGFVTGLVEFTTALLQASSAMPGVVSIFEVAVAAFVAALTKATLAAQSESLIKSGHTVFGNLLGSSSTLLGLGAGVGMYMIGNLINQQVEAAQTRKLQAQNRVEAVEELRAQETSQRKQAIQTAVDTIQGFVDQGIKFSDELNSSDLESYTKAIETLNDAFGSDFTGNLLQAKGSVVDFESAIKALKETLDDYTVEEYKNRARKAIIDKPFINDTTLNYGLANMFSTSLGNNINARYDFFANVLPQLGGGYGIDSFSRDQGNLFTYNILRNNANLGTAREFQTEDALGLHALYLIANTIEDEKYVPDLINPIKDYLKPFATEALMTAFDDIANGNDILNEEELNKDFSMAIVGAKIYDRIRSIPEYSDYLKAAGYDAEAIIKDFPSLYKTYWNDQFYDNGGIVQNSTDDLWTFLSKDILRYTYNYRTGKSGEEALTPEYTFKDLNGKTLFSFKSDELTNDAVQNAFIRNMEETKNKLDAVLPAQSKYAGDTIAAKNNALLAQGDIEYLNAIRPVAEQYAAAYAKAAVIPTKEQAFDWLTGQSAENAGLYKITGLSDALRRYSNAFKPEEFIYSEVDTSSFDDAIELIDKDIEYYEGLAASEETAAANREKLFDLTTELENKNIEVQNAAIAYGERTYKEMLLVAQKERSKDISVINSKASTDISKLAQRSTKQTGLAYSDLIRVANMTDEQYAAYIEKRIYGYNNTQTPLSQSIADLTTKQTLAESNLSIANTSYENALSKQTEAQNVYDQELKNAARALYEYDNEQYQINQRRDRRALVDTYYKEIENNPEGYFKNIVLNGKTYDELVQEVIDNTTDAYKKGVYGSAYDLDYWIQQNLKEIDVNEYKAAYFEQIDDILNAPLRSGTGRYVEQDYINRVLSGDYAAEFGNNGAIVALSAASDSLSVAQTNVSDAKSLVGEIETKLNTYKSDLVSLNGQLENTQNNFATSQKAIDDFRNEAVGIYQQVEAAQLLIPSAESQAEIYAQKDITQIDVNSPYYAALVTAMNSPEESAYRSLYNEYMVIKAQADALQKQDLNPLSSVGMSSSEISDKVASLKKQASDLEKQKDVYIRGVKRTQLETWKQARAKEQRDATAALYEYTDEAAEYLFENDSEIQSRYGQEYSNAYKGVVGEDPIIKAYDDLITASNSAADYWEGLTNDVEAKSANLAAAIETGSVAKAEYYTAAQQILIDAIEQDKTKIQKLLNAAGFNQKEVSMDFELPEGYSSIDAYVEDLKAQLAQYEAIYDGKSFNVEMMQQVYNSTGSPALSWLFGLVTNTQAEAAAPLYLAASKIPYDSSNPEGFFSMFGQEMGIEDKYNMDVIKDITGFNEAVDTRNRAGMLDALYTAITGKGVSEWNSSWSTNRATAQNQLRDLNNLVAGEDIEDISAFSEIYKQLGLGDEATREDIIANADAIAARINDNYFGTNIAGLMQVLSTLIAADIGDMDFNTYLNSDNVNPEVRRLIELANQSGVSLGFNSGTKRTFIKGYTGLTPSDNTNILTGYANTSEYWNNIAAGYLEAGLGGEKSLSNYISGLTDSTQKRLLSSFPELVEYFNLSETDRQTRYGQNLKREIDIKFATSGLDELEQAGEILEGMTQNVRNMMSADFTKAFKGMYQTAQTFSESGRALELYDRAVAGERLTQEQWNTIGSAFGISDMSMYQSGIFSLDTLADVANAQRNINARSALEAYKAIVKKENGRGNDRSEAYKQMMERYGYKYENGEFVYDETADQSWRLSSAEILADRYAMRQNTADMYDQTAAMFALYNMATDNDFIKRLDDAGNASLKAMWDSMAKSGNFDKYLSEGGTVTDIDAVRRLLFAQAFGFDSNAYTYSQNDEVANLVDGLLNGTLSKSALESYMNKEDWGQISSAASTVIGSQYNELLRLVASGETPSTAQLNRARQETEGNLIADLMKYSNYSAAISQMYDTYTNGTGAQRNQMMRSYQREALAYGNALWALEEYGNGGQYNDTVMQMIMNATGLSETEVRNTMSKTGGKEKLQSMMRESIAETEKGIMEYFAGFLGVDVDTVTSFDGEKLRAQLQEKMTDASEEVQGFINMLLSILDMINMPAAEDQYQSFETYVGKAYGNRYNGIKILRDIISANGQYNASTINGADRESFVANYGPLAWAMANGGTSDQILGFAQEYLTGGHSFRNDIGLFNSMAQSLGYENFNVMDMSAENGDYSWLYELLTAMKTGEGTVPFYEYLAQNMGGLSDMYASFTDETKDTATAVENFLDVLKDSEAMERYGKNVGVVIDYNKALKSTSTSSAKAIGDLYSSANKIGYQYKTIFGAKGKKGSQLGTDELDVLGQFVDKDLLKTMDEKGVSDLIDNLSNDLQNTMNQEIMPRVDTNFQNFLDGLGAQREHFNMRFDAIVDADGNIDLSALMALVEQFGGDAHAIFGSIDGITETLQVETTSGEDWISYAIKLIGGQLGKGTGGVKTGGGGGGGGKSKLQKYLEKWAKKFAVYDHEIKMIQYQETKYQNAGELSNYGAMIELENEAQLRYISNLEKAISGIKGKMKTLEKESDDWYAAREAVMKYEEQIEAANQAIRDNTKKLEENQQAIYKTRTDLEDLVRSEADTREKTRRDILSATVSMEETILEAIRKRYQDEWDLIKRDIDRKRNALEEEKNLINERLQARKDAEQEAEKYEQLAEYQRQLAYVSMDPTRTKDALELQHKIDELQKELAWTTAEREAQAQQEAIDDQIQAYDQFAQIGDEDLAAYLEDANNFAEQVKALLEGSQEELMSWLKANIDEYKLALDEQQQNMVESWTDTWKTIMHITETWSDLIIEILTGRDSFINYMKQSDEYLLATDEMRPQLLYKWNEMWDDYINSRITGATYSHTDDWMGVGTSGSSSSSGSGGGPGNNSQTTSQTEPIGANEELGNGTGLQSMGDGLLANLKTHGYSFKIGNTTYSDSGYGSKDSASAAGYQALAALVAAEHLPEIYRQQGLATMVAYREGGLADYTGLAWVDGTKARPEAFLSADDTKLMRGFLNAARYVSVAATMTTIPDDMFTSNNGQNIEAVNITINEATINDDMDIQELAEKIGSSFIKELSINGVNSSKYSY